MFTITLYAAAALLYGISAFKDLKKTKLALKKTYMVFMNLLPQLLGLFIIVGMLLAIVNPSLISSVLGEGSGLLGVFLAAGIGSITLLPGFVAFPLASQLLDQGAGLAQIATFVSALMMVGIATFALEAKTFGKKTALMRNGLSLILSLLMAVIVGGILK